MTYVTPNKALCVSLLGVVLVMRSSALVFRRVLMDVVLDQDLAFLSAARSTSDCARQCAAREGSCLTFTLVLEGSERWCRGHSSDVTLPGVASSASPGARTYRLLGEDDDDVTTSGSNDVTTSGTNDVTTSGTNDVTTSPLPISDWLNTACSSTADCLLHSSLLVDVECYKNLCLCIPGYYYSLSQKNCVYSCANMAASFTKYPDSGIASNNDVTMSDTLPDVSLPACASNPWCRSVDYYYATSRQDSYLQSVTARDVPADWESDKPNVDYYNRDCV